MSETHSARLPQVPALMYFSRRVMSRINLFQRPIDARWYFDAARPSCRFPTKFRAELPNPGETKVSARTNT